MKWKSSKKTRLAGVTSVCILPPSQVCSHLWCWHTCTHPVMHTWLLNTGLLDALPPELYHMSAFRKPHSSIHRHAHVPPSLPCVTARVCVSLYYRPQTWKQGNVREAHGPSLPPVTVATHGLCREWRPHGRNALLHPLLPSPAKPSHANWLIH